MPTHRVVKIDELSQYFHLPEKAVAKQLGVCLTSLKKICRQNGITRWPYRKLKSLDKKINKIENALTNSAEDPSAMLVKWEMLKLEKKNLPFSGNSDDSDSETRKSSPPPVVSLGRASPISSSCTSTPLPDEKLNAPDWASCTASPASPGASVASGASTPNPGAPVRAMHTLLEQKLRQVGCVTTHREQLARNQGAMVDSPRIVLNRPDELDICLEDEAMSMAPVSGELNISDFYRLDSARFNSARSNDGLNLEENFRIAPLSANAADNFSFGDLFPIEEPDSNMLRLNDSLFADEFLPPMSS